jgi:hypothetical protein
MNKLKKSLINFLILILFITLSLLSMIVVNYLNTQSQAISITEIPKYGIKGLPYGYELSSEVRLIDEKYVYFEDRIVEMYTNNSNVNIESINSIQNFMNVIPDNVNKFVSIIPMAITYEELELYNKASIEAITEIRNGINEDIGWIDVDSLFGPISEEYLYFRTDPRITSIGAYYIAKDFLKSKGIDIYPIDKYKEDRRTKVLGIYMYLENANLSQVYEDNVIFYLLDGATNKQKVTIRTGDDSLTFESPTIAVSRRGLNVFVEGNISDSIIYGDGLENSIIVIGDYSAKVLSTWLIPYYKNIIVINSAFYSKSKSDFFKLFEDYNVSDILLIESVSNIGDSSMNSKLKLISE